MRIPIRMIGIATTVIWAFLILFSVTAIYSMKDIRVNLGQLQVNTTENHEVILSFPLTIVNTGLYDLADFNISTVVFGANNTKVTDGSSFMPMVFHERTVNVTHSMKLNVTELLQTNRELAFNDTELKANMTVSMRAAKSIPILASSNITIPWGAPLSNLAVSNPEFSAYNQTHSRVAVPVSFENHAFFNLTGKIQLRVYGTAGNLLTQTAIDVDVPQYSPYKGKVEMFIPLRAVSRTHFEVFFVSSYFNYGPLVVPYGT